jgi:hypothetical protein
VVSIIVRCRLLGLSARVGVCVWLAERPPSNLGYYPKRADCNVLLSLSPRLNMGLASTVTTNSSTYRVQGSDRLPAIRWREVDSIVDEKSSDLESCVAFRTGVWSRGVLYSWMHQSINTKCKNTGWIESTSSDAVARVA